jgi:hypothetical protein
MTSEWRRSTGTRNLKAAGIFQISQKPTVYRLAGIRRRRAIVGRSDCGATGRGQVPGSPATEPSVLLSRKKKPLKDLCRIVDTALIKTLI